VFVNGRMIFGKRTAAEIQELINDELERNRIADAGIKPAATGYTLQ
jgi:hypothetical protein